MCREITENGSGYYLIFVEFQMGKYFNIEDLNILKDFHESVINITSFDETTIALRLTIEHTIHVLDLSNVEALVFDNEKETTQNLSLMSFQIADHSLLMPPDVTITYTRFHSCVLVPVLMGDIQDRLTNDIIFIPKDISIDLSNVNENTTHASGSDGVFMCETQYRDFIENVMKRTTPDDFSPQTEVFVNAKGFITFICNCGSILFAFLVVVTYASLKQLRTQPGVNNMFLACHLIAAQALFQFGSVQSGIVSKTVCAIIGIVLHLSWLLVMFWMNICTINMYRVFVTSQGLSSVMQSTTKTTLVYVCYCWVSSVVIVMAHMAVSLTLSNGLSIGYAGRICYIASQAMVVYFFAVPVFCIVIVNLILFTVVVINIKRSSLSQRGGKNHRNLLTIYIKMSILTGCTWIFGFVYMFTGIVWMEFVFIILNSLQGFFLFVAFVCNRRVYDNLKTRFNIKRDQGKTAAHP
ncbi:hypothetical protein DPMN_168452 [Dreissena polymorpha]|uniref:G-protein coupled receptors family 2 profile 2 domain-containing protein n=1 Tax=Dreissena polymorpha TaxID=45954 RepID=A0A9D4F0P0_DREPO|nr:hypothetical protein DPMN_168449 [Dreissena polymorpha]KAH3790255.1 hypothetical protein DPMN_168452 [Dreissena polymorpha]